MTLNASKDGKSPLHSLISRQIDPTDSMPLNIHEIKNYIYYGFSSSELRPKYWKVLLEYYSTNQFKTETFLRTQRRSYKFYREKSEASPNTAIYDVIENDVARTFILPELRNTKKICTFLDSTSTNTDETHRSIIISILKCYAITNSSIGYVQGMAHLLIPIYYVLYLSTDIEDKTYAEQDSFFCFNYLMTEIGNNFVNIFDHQKSGITNKLKNVFVILAKLDPKLCRDMKKKGLTETAFHMKWVMLLFSSVFSIDDVIWLWDRFLSDSYRFEMVEFCCVSIVMIMKTVIVREDFDECMKLLQEPKIIDIETVFNLADELRRAYYKDAQ